jgi:hypothetical protein
MNLAHRVLHSLGATKVFDVNVVSDPKTEEEFNAIRYESETPITWEQYQERYPSIELKFGTKQLRYVRNILLSDTDWVMTTDVFQSLTNKEEWIAYRQALRDLPENPPVFKWKEARIDIDNMDMPVKPPILRSTPS